MAQNPGVRIRRSPVRSYAVAQRNFPGAQTAKGLRGWKVAPASPNADLGSDNDVHQRLCVFNRWLMAAGAWTAIGADVSSTSFAGLDLLTGLPDPRWDLQFRVGTLGPATEPFAPRALATDGAFLYVTGNFDHASASAGGPLLGGLQGLCRYDANGVLDQTWLPAAASAGRLDGRALAYNPDRRTLYVGFSYFAAVTVGGHSRKHACELSVIDGSATPWDPQADDEILALAYDPIEAAVYAGGKFLNIGGAARNRLAKLPATDSAAAEAWDPSADNWVLAIVPDPTRFRVYVAGLFANVGGAARAHVAELTDAAVATTWNPNPDGTFVGAIAKWRGKVFMTGDFTHVGATVRNRLACVQEDGTLQAWDPNLSAHGQAMVQLDRTFYVGGSFVAWSGTQSYLAAVPFPIFTDANTIFFAHVGDDANSGVRGSPVRTIPQALSMLGGAFCYALCLDSARYYDPAMIAYAANEDGGLFADDGQAPTIGGDPGTVAGTFGAARAGRTHFGPPAITAFLPPAPFGAAGTLYHISKVGNDGTGARGDPTKPFLTIQAVVNNWAAVGLDKDSLVFEDSGAYVEDVSFAAAPNARSFFFVAQVGQIPTLSPATPGGTHINTASSGFVPVSLFVYGMTFIGGTFTGTAVGGFVYAAESSFLGYAKHISSLFGGEYWNNLFAKSSGEALHLGPPADAQNNYFESCASGIVVPSAGALVFQGNTFHNCGTAGIAVVGPCSNPTIFRGNLFLEDRASPPAADGIQLDHCDHLVVDQCRFVGLGGHAIVDAATGDSAAAIALTNCVAERCGSAGEGAFKINYGAHEIGAAYTLSGLVAIACRGHGIQVLESDGAPIGPLTITHCVALNCAGDGFNINTTLPAAVVGFAESGSGGHAIDRTGSTAAVTATYGIAQTATAGGVVLGTDFFQDDPQFLVTSAGLENVAPRSASPLQGLDLGANAGLDTPVLAVASATRRFDVDGFVFEGPANLRSGAAVLSGVVNPIEFDWCAFVGLGAYGLRLASRATARNCTFACSGAGVVLTEGAATAERCVANGCGAAGLLLQGVGAILDHNTATLCEYGQFDLLVASAQFQRDNVYSGNGTADYAGGSVQDHSDVGDIEGDGVVTNGSRLDARFRDLDGGDLRLQAVAVGYQQNSPAVGLAHDGSDAGAFDMIYGPLSLTWTVLDLGAAGMRNPDDYLRGSVPTMLIHFMKWLGDLVSDSPAFRRTHRFAWRPVNDMPAAQVLGLVATYESGDGETQLSFDGGATWIPTRVDRSQAFTWTELQGLAYSSDAVPTPVGAIVFQESA